MNVETLAIVGVGLIGGSIGLAAKRRGLARRVLGVGRQQSSLDRAAAAGIIDEGLLDPVLAARQAEIVVVCTPVDSIAEQVLAIAPVCPPGTLLTDAGSTKARIVATIEPALPAGVHFVGSHPLAGSEKQGPEHADENLFQDRLTIVTRTAATEPQALEKTSTFWRALGSKVRVMEPTEHDKALAFTSHLPHLVAAALAGALPGAWGELTASGFRDTTRIAAGDPALWTAIFSQNHAAVLDALGLLLDRLERCRECLSAGNWAALNDLLVQAKKVRDALGS
jgi:cyclohexadieny/prephenate dehydrogenase